MLIYKLKASKRRSKDLILYRFMCKIYTDLWYNYNFIDNIMEDIHITITITINNATDK